MSQTTNKNSKSNKNTTSKPNKPEVDYAKEIEELKKMVKMLSEQNAQLRETKEEEVKVVYKEDKEPNPSRMIKVISLCANELNLSQYERGEGKVYRFSKLGVSKSIPANILDDIVSSHLSLAEKGYFYICDEDFVREHGLEGDYSNLVNATVIDTIFKEDKATLKKVLMDCKMSQLDTILSVVAQKILNNIITLDELEDSGKVSVINKVFRERTGNEEYNFEDVVQGLQEIKKSK